MRRKKAQISIYFVFLIISIIVVAVTAVFAPLGAQFSQQMYTAGEGIINRSQASLNQISDANVKNQINAIYVGAQANTVDNIEVTTGLYKYSWIIVIILAGTVLFLFTRRLVEYGQVV